MQKKKNVLEEQSDTDALRKRPQASAVTLALGMPLVTVQKEWNARLAWDQIPIQHSNALYNAISIF